MLYINGEKLEPVDESMYLDRMFAKDRKTDGEILIHAHIGRKISRWYVRVLAGMNICQKKSKWLSIRRYFCLLCDMEVRAGYVKRNKNNDIQW